MINNASDGVSCVAGVPVVAALVNNTSTRIVAWLNANSFSWKIVGAIAVIILISAVVLVHQPGSYVFGHFNDISLRSSSIPNNGDLLLNSWWAC